MLPYMDLLQKIPETAVLLLIRREVTMKKVLSILLSMSLLLGLAACSKEAGSESGETTEENAGLSLQDYDINSMSIDEVMDLLISVVDIPEGCHSWEEEEPRVGSTEAVNYRLFGVGNDDFYDGPTLNCTYSMTIIVSELDPSEITEYSAGDFYESRRITAISGRLLLTCSEVTNYDAYNDDLNNVGSSNTEYTLDYFNDSEPFSDPNVQAVYDLFVALGETAVPDDSSVDIQEETREEIQTESQTESTASPYSSASNEWTGRDDLTNTDSIELDLTGIEDYSSIYYTVEYYGTVVYTSETGTYQGVYNTSMPGALIKNGYLASGRYTVSFYDVSDPSVPITSDSCVVSVSQVPVSDSSSMYVEWFDGEYVGNPYTYSNTTYIDLDIFTSYDSRWLFYDVRYNGALIYTSDLDHWEAYFTTDFDEAVTDGPYLAAGEYEITFYNADTSDAPLRTGTCTVTVD